MRRTVLSALLVIASTVAASAQRPVSAGYRASADVALRVWVPTGLVRLIGWDRDSIDVTGTTGRRGSYFGGGAGGAAKLGIEAINPKDPALPGGDLTIKVPRNARVWVKMTSGHMDAEGLRGELEAYVVGGSVAVRDVAGVLTVETIDAPITVDRSGGALRIRGGRGNVTLRDVAGTATVTTISGDVVLAGPRVPEARVETIGGAITALAALSSATQLDLQTHAGRITIAVDPRRLPVFDLAARAGKVTNAFPAAKGEGRVVARSFRGDINVRGADGIEVRK